MNMRILITLVVLLSLAASSLDAQIVKKAQVGFRFLENPVAADVVARGATGVVAARNAGGLFWNPALIGWTSSTADISLNRTQGIADINYNAAAATLRLGDIGVVGISFLSMDYGDFYGTRRSTNAQGYEETGVFSPTAMAVGLAWAQKVSDRFSYGVQVKYAYQDLGSAWVAPTGGTLGDPSLTLSQIDYAKGDFAIDVGAFYDFLYNGIRFGATLQNISRELKYESQEFPMPFAVSFGLTVEPLQFFMDGEGAKELLLCFESRHPRDFSEKVKVGAEYSFQDVVIFRAGYQGNYDERGLTAGLGFRYVLEGVPLRADYAYEKFGVFGAVHHFSIGFSY